MASYVADPSELFCLLETTDTGVDEVKALIHENLNQTKESSYLNSLVDFYLSTGSTRCLEVLVGIREPHDKHLFDKLNDGLKGSTRLQMLMLLSQVVYRHPSWLYRISQHSLLSTLLKVLKTDNEAANLVSAILILVTLLPVIPASIGPFLNDIFDIFTRLASLYTKKTGQWRNIPDVYLMHLLVGVYALFHRVYGMYPCHFVGYMRNYCNGSSREHLQVFTETIRPMFDFVRLHPLLITASKEIEVSTTRWKHMETHDIVVECAKLSLDVVEGTREDSPGLRLIYPTFRPIQEVCQMLHSSQGLTQLTNKICTTNPSNAIVKQISNVDFSETWSPSVTCGLSTPPKTLRSSPTSQSSAYQNDNVSSGRMRTGIGSSGSVTPVPLQRSVPISPLKMENSPFKFTSIVELSTAKHGEDTGSSSMHSMPSRTLQTPGVPMLMNLNQVVRRLEEHKNNEKEDLIDSEVATIIGQGAIVCNSENASSRPARETPVAPRPSAPFQSSRTVHGPIQSCFSPYIKSLQTAQRSRSFSQGKKLPRRATIDVTERRVFSLSRSHSLPDLRDLIQSTDIMGDEVSDQYVITGSSPVQPLKTLEQQATADISNVVADYSINYAQMLPSAFPQLLCPSCQKPRMTETDATAAPLFSQLSPLEILDRYVASCGNVHSKRLVCEAKPPKDSYSKGKAMQEENSILIGQVQLLHIQLLYERHKREIHAERNRRLLGKAKRAKALEEQNAAMKDQMQLQENEIAQLLREAGLLQNERHNLSGRLETELDAVRMEFKSVCQQKNTLEISCNGLKQDLTTTKMEVVLLQKELEKLQSDLFNTHHELQSIQSQVSLNDALSREVRRLNKELLLSVELNQRYQEKVCLLENNNQFELKLSSLHESHSFELNNVKAALESKEACVESLKARVTKLEGMLVKKDKTISEHKRLLNSVKEEYDEQVKVVEDKYNSRRLICQHLESEILKLHHKLDSSVENVAAADRVCRRGSQSRSSRQGSNPISMVSAKGATNADESVHNITSTVATNTLDIACHSQTIIEVQLPIPENLGNTSDVTKRRRASEPIDIDPGTGVGQRSRRRHKDVSQKHPRCEEDDDDDDSGDLLLCPDVFPKQERISGALESITSQSLASLVEFGEGQIPMDTKQELT